MVWYVYVNGLICSQEEYPNGVPEDKILDVMCGIEEFADYMDLRDPELEKIDGRKLELFYTVSTEGDLHMTAKREEEEAAGDEVEVIVTIRKKEQQ